MRRHNLVTSGTSSTPSAWFCAQTCICLQVRSTGRVRGDLLDVVGIGHCCREGGRRGRVFYRFCERAQDVAWHPALGGRRLAVRRPKHKVHVLLVGGQDLDDLPLTDADLVLFERRIVLSDRHGGRGSVASAVGVLARKEEGGGEEKRRGRTNRRVGGKWREA